MNNKKITIITAALVALVAVSGVAFSTFAQDDTEITDNKLFEQKRMGSWYNMSDEEILEKKAEFKVRYEERQAERELRRDAVEAAMDAEDYNAWVSAHDEDAPILEKINVDNFSKLIEAHNYFEQGRVIMEELGIERGQGKGVGKGGFGRHGIGGKMIR